MMHANASPSPDDDVVYTHQLAMVITHIMVKINKKATTMGASFGQQYILQKGLKIFGKCGEVAASKEMDQLHQHNCFTPINVKKLMPTKKKKAMEALMFLIKKGQVS